MRTISAADRQVRLQAGADGAVRGLQGAGLPDQPIVRVLARAVKRNCTRCTPTRAQALRDLCGDAVSRDADAEVLRPQLRQLGEKIPRIAAPQRVAAADEEAAGPLVHGLGCIEDLGGALARDQQRRWCGQWLNRSLAHQRQTQVDRVLARQM